MRSPNENPFPLARIRTRVAWWLLGADWALVIGRLWLIHDRAKVAIQPDGSVILAKCESLAEALYKPIPGVWTVTISRNGAA
jgi:hypothetical protein